MPAKPAKEYLVVGRSLRVLPGRVVLEITDCNSRSGLVYPRGCIPYGWNYKDISWEFA